MRRSRLYLREAYEDRGPCFYTGGVNLAAVIALISGFVVAKLAPASMMASLVSLFAAAVVYFISLKVLYRKTSSETKDKDLNSSPSSSSADACSVTPRTGG